MKPLFKFAMVLVALTLVLSAVATMLLIAAPAASALASPAGSGVAVNEMAGWGMLAASLATALAAAGAGFAVGKVGAAAIGALVEKPELFGRLLIFVGLAEGIAIYGLIVSILILNRLG